MGILVELESLATPHGADLLLALGSAKYATGDLLDAANSLQKAAEIRKNTKTEQTEEFCRILSLQEKIKRELKDFESADTIHRQRTSLLTKSRFSERKRQVQHTLKASLSSSLTKLTESSSWEVP